MDATRPRRTRDKVRQSWYARHRQRRFARFLGFGDVVTAPGRTVSEILWPAVSVSPVWARAPAVG
jgi:hypothetical protein